MTTTRKYLENREVLKIKNKENAEMKKLMAKMYTSFRRIRREVNGEARIEVIQAECEKYLRGVKSGRKEF